MKKKIYLQKWLLTFICLVATSNLFSQNTAPEITNEKGTVGVTYDLVKDAYVFRLYPNNYYGTQDQIISKVWTYSNNLYVHRAFFQIDLEELELVENFESAKLFLFGSNMTNLSSGNNRSYLAMAKDEWSEDTLCWNNQPDVYMDSIISIPKTNTTRDYEIDITHFVNQWRFNDTIENNGIMLRIYDEAHTFSEMSFYSREVDDMFKKPRLVIYQPEYGTTVDDDLEIGSPIYDVNAIDGEGDAITYSILSGNTNDQFTIDSQTGEITLNKELAFESLPEYQFDLSVQVQDDGVGNLSTTRTIIIKVINVNEPVVVKESMGSVTVYEDFERFGYAVNSVFLDIDSVDFTASVLSVTPAIVNASIENDSIIITSILDLTGTVEIIVSATDGEFTTTDTLVLTVDEKEGSPYLNENCKKIEVYRMFDSVVIDLDTMLLDDVTDLDYNSVIDITMINNVSITSASVDEGNGHLVIKDKVDQSGLSSFLLKYTDGENVTGDTIFVNVIDGYKGLIHSNTTWKNSVKLYGDISIPAGIALSVSPNAIIKSKGYYKIDVDGQILAKGNANGTILFSVESTEGFNNFSADSGAWQGIELDQLTVSDSTIFEYCIFEYAKNITQGIGFGNSGGAISINGNCNVRISNCIFRNNYAPQGGAIACFNNNSLIIRQTSFNSNQANNGGAIYINEASPIVDINEFYGNYAFEYGGAISIENLTKELEISNNIIFKNSSENEGGAIYTNNVPVKLLNNSILSNSTVNGYGGGFFSNKGKVGCYNTILWNNLNAHTSYQYANNDKGSSFIFQNCDVQNGFTNATTSSEPFTLSESENLDLEPVFIDTADNDYRLSGMSPLIDMGEATGHTFYGIDFWGGNRVENNKIDIGAFEMCAKNNIDLFASLSDLTLDEDFDKYIIGDLTKYMNDSINEEAVQFTVVSIIDPSVVKTFISSDAVLYLNSQSELFGNDTLVVTAKNSYGYIVTDTFNITINPVEDAPYFSNLSPARDSVYIEDDAFVFSKSANLYSLFGDKENLLVKRWSYNQVWATHRVYLKFSLPKYQLDPNSQSDLHLFGITNQSGDTRTQLYLAAGNWNEDVLNWANQPGYDNSTYINIPKFSSSSYVINISSLVSEWANEGVENNGLAWLLNNESAKDYREFSVASSEAVEELKPYVTFINPIRTITIPDTIVENTAIDTIIGIDGDNDPLYYSIEEGNESGIFSIDNRTGEISIVDTSEIVGKDTTICLGIGLSNSSDGNPVVVNLLNIKVELLQDNNDGNDNGDDSSGGDDSGNGDDGNSTDITTSDSNKEIFTLFPNPANSSITLTFKGLMDKQPGYVIISDLGGKQIMQQEVNSNTTHVDISRLQAGFYLYSISIDEKVLRGKFIKK